VSLVSSFRVRCCLTAAVAFAAIVAAVPAYATKIQRVVTPAGIEAWLVQDRTVPLIALEYAFSGGTSQDPADKPGVGNLITALLDEGAGELDAKAFQERMEDQAIELRFSADRDHFRGSLRTLAARRHEAFDLLRLALNAPRFDADAIERIRAQTLVQLQRETTSPTDLATKTWWSTAFPGHPYGRPEKGTLDTVAQIKAEDLRSYVRKVFGRDKLKIAIVGDIEPVDAAAVVDAVFAKLPAKAELMPLPPARPTGLGRRVVVDFNVPQSVVSLGGLGLARKHPDFIPAYVVNHILGGGSFTSRLYQEVREKRGYAYGVSTFLYPMQASAMFMGWTQVRGDRTGDAIRIIEEEIQQMAEKGPTADELEKAKAYLKGSYALRFDTSTKIAGQLVQIQLDELGIDYIDRRNALIDAVTLEDTKRVSNDLLQGKLLIAVVGKPVGVTSTAPGQ
jgi:zinc protease